MTSNLEHRYRVLLKALPQWYREDREEEMVSLFLEGRDELDLEYCWPGWAEAFSTWGLAARVRMGAHGGPARTVALGDLVRRLALCVLLLDVFFVGATGVNWAQTAANPEAVWTPWALLQLLPVLVLALVLGGRWTLAKVVAGVGLLPGIYSLTVIPDWFGVAFSAPSWIGFVLLCLGFHRHAPKPAAWPWWLAAGVAFVLGAFAMASADGLAVYLGAVIALAVVVVVLATRALVPGFRRP